MFKIFQSRRTKKTRKVTFKRKSRAGTRKCPRCGGDGVVKVRKRK